jgi:hypothetical protein
MYNLQVNERSCNIPTPPWTLVSCSNLYGYADFINAHFLIPKIKQVKYTGKNAPKKLQELYNVRENIENGLNKIRGEGTKRTVTTSSLMNLVSNRMQNFQLLAL